MKIEISEESFEFIKNLSKEINIQNNRCTANPFFYIIKDKEMRCVIDGNGQDTYYTWSDDDDNNLLTKEYIIETILSDDPNCKNPVEIFEGLLNNDEIISHEVAEFHTIPENHNIFFTEKACVSHMESNRHHFREPYSYVQYAGRNPEINKLLKVVHEIASCGETK